MASNATSPAQVFGRRPLLRLGVVGSVLFIVAFLVEGATRADYSPLRHPVSSLSIGDQGWTQITNFILTGLLLIGFAVGLARGQRGARRTVWGPLLIGIIGAGLVGAGLFVCDPLNGYPPGSELVPTIRTFHGRLHDLFSLPFFLGTPLACFVFGRHFFQRGDRTWAVYSVLTGLGMFVCFVLAGMGFQQRAGFADVAGLFQRASLLITFAWMALLSLKFTRDESSTNW